MVEADMHTHSYFSDGYDSPIEIFKKAKEKGLKAVCITDHDEVRGVSDVKYLAYDLGIDTLSGVEITTIVNGVDVHILGYGIKFQYWSEWVPLLKYQWNAQNKRAQNILDKYAYKGIMRATIKDVRNKARCCGSAVSPLHIRLYRSLNSDISFEETKKEVWRGGYFWSEIDESLLMSPVDAVVCICHFGGIPVLAHPGKFIKEANQDVRNSLKIFFKLLNVLESVGLKGLECFSPKHSAKQNQLFSGLAKERGLIITGGSDYHGFFDVKDNFGKAGISYEQFLQIKNLCK